MTFYNQFLIMIYLSQIFSLVIIYQNFMYNSIIVKFKNLKLKIIL